jgi:hypothetical protein
MPSADVKDVAAVLADFGFQSSPLAAARALLAAARHPKEAADEEDGYHDKHDDDCDRHPKRASGRFAPGTERTIAARIARAARGMTIGFIRALGD